MIVLGNDHATGVAIAETRNWNGAVYAPSDVARLGLIACGRRPGFPDKLWRHAA